MERRSRSALSLIFPIPPKPVAAVLALVLAAPLVGCSGPREKFDAENGVDARQRHRIAIANQPITLDVFPSSGHARLDTHTQQQVAAFARRYSEIGSGPISIVVPQSGPNADSGARAVEPIRYELARAGAHAPVAVSHYPVENPSLAAPVRIAFQGLKAKVVHRCGDWPEDLASGSSTGGWQNRSYWNLGCANQNMIATQVADPRDLAAPRGETPADPTMRMRAIGNVRKGTDPATNWTTKNSNIGAVGE
ncbi:MAG: CpaD family pilus assembly protein [Rhodoblastus sp.]